MRRRTVLAGLTLTALPGCGTIDGRETQRPTFGVEPRTSDTPDPNDREAYADGPPGEPARTVNTDGIARRATLFDLASDAPGLGYDVGFLGQDAGDPVRLWIAVRNESDDSRTLEFDGAVPFGAPVGVSLVPDDATFVPEPEGPRLWLVPTEDPAYEPVRPATTTTGCWRADGTLDGVGRIRSVTLDPGEHAGQTFELLTPPETDGCLPPGTYRFETADGRLGFSLALWRPTVGPPASDLGGNSLPPAEAETTWFHDARDADAAMYLRPTSESFAADRTVTFTLHNHGTEPVTTRGHQLLRSDGTAWLPVLDADPTLARHRELVPPGGTTTLDVGFGRYGPDVSLRALRSGHYALRLRLEAVDAHPAAAVSVTTGTDPSLSTTASHRTVYRSDGVVTLDRDRGDQDGAVVELEQGGPAEATAIPLERVLRFEALRNALASLRADDEATTVRLLTEPYRAERAAESLRRLEGPADAFAFRSETYTVSISW